MDIRPRVTARNYVSYFFGPYHAWFEELGYPLLDAIVHEDGEWGIIECFNVPVLPAQTKWQWVVVPQHRYALTFGAVKRMTDQLDLEKRWFWEEQERREEQLELERIRQELHVDDMTNRMFQAIKGNDGLMNRIARNGLQEASLFNLSRHIPNSHFRKDKPHGNHANVRHHAISSRKDLSS